MKLLTVILIFFSGLDISDNYLINSGEIEKHGYIKYNKPYTIYMGSDSQLWIKQSKGEGFIEGVGDKPARIFLVNDDLNAYNGLRFRGNYMIIYGDCEG